MCPIRFRDACLCCAPANDGASDRSFSHPSKGGRQSLSPPELEKGVIPGTVAPVFETDFGLVGLLICFDLNFPEVRVALRQSKPDLVVFSSLYRGGLQAQALAYELRAFVVTSIASELGLIIDRAGRIIKESTYEALAVAPINTNSVAMHAAGHAIDHTGARQFEAQERLALPADS